MNKYYYKAEGYSAKVIIPFTLMIAGVLMILYIPVESEFMELLISLFYIVGFILLFFDTIPFIFRVLKSRGQGIFINNNSIILFNKRESKGVKKERKIDRKDISRIELISYNGKSIISPEDKISEIEDKIHKISGRRLSIYSNKTENKFLIYLELLDEEFLLNFINWYQGKKTGDYL